MSEVNLMAAHNQWASRPADERFATIEDLYLNAVLSYNNAKAANLTMGQVSVVADGNNLKLKAPQGLMSFSNWSFSQFANRVGSPAGFLAELPAQMAADVLNERISKFNTVDSQLYYDEPSLLARALTSTTYGRLPNHEVCKAVIQLPGDHVTPPARPVDAGTPGARIATEADCKVSTLVQPGDLIANAGLYGSDRDIWIFRMFPKNTIDDGSEGGLSRGFFVSNSEVGDKTFSVTMFMLRHVCGNHICWGASNIQSIKIKHSGRTVRERALASLASDVKRFAEMSSKEDEALIKVAKEKELGSTYEEVVQLIFRDKKLLTKKNVEAAYNAANEHADVDGSPRSIWGFSQGVTRISQLSPFADERNELDMAAGKILSFAN